MENDKNHQAIAYDTLYMLIIPITRSRAKMVKEEFNGKIYDI